VIVHTHTHARTRAHTHTHTHTHKLINVCVCIYIYKTQLYYNLLSKIIAINNHYIVNIIKLGNNIYYKHNVIISLIRKLIRLHISCFFRHQKFL